LKPGERRTLRQTIALPQAKLWTPATPNLYVVESSTGGDSASTRFGMREFHFDTATRRAYLNGKLIFLRGSNIALHRFFEDPECKARPWDREWVRRLLVDLPKKMNWNSFRFTIGPAPQFWFDLADEAGLLIQNEFPVWQGRWNEWKPEEMVTEYSEWMRDHWNHPSLAIWDASNETHGEWLADNVLPKVRPLDLSARPWDNGYTLPMEANDPVEDHPYLLIGWWKPQYPPFEMVHLEKLTGAKTDWNSPHPTTHAVMINEYGWLWLNRDGTPTLLTESVYDRLVGAKATAEQRFEAYAYLLGGLTEYWRAHRQAAGVQYFVYLTCSYPGVKTSDNFRDIARLELEPHFADYVREAFKPLGAYINFWQPSLRRGEKRRYDVMLINDEAEPVSGTLSLVFEPAPGGPTMPATTPAAAQPMVRAEVPFALPAYGQQTYPIELQAPDAPGSYVLKATARQPGEPTVSRRKVEVR
jgi:beta-galactosidase/beta-glucuronidase